MQDPLSEHAALCNDADEILCLKLHPLQDLVAQDVLRERLHRAFIDVVNHVGVDINRTILHKHMRGTLRFVSGLGPRKARALINALERRGGMVQSREEIEDILAPADQLDEEDSLSRVYNNCAGFIRIRPIYFTQTEEDQLDVLDDTRVHPLDYEIARQMVADALDSNEPEANWQFLVQDIIDQVDALEEIDLDSFADDWERSGRGKKKDTLYDIKDELADPYGDNRVKWRPPNVEELFTMLTGESRESFGYGTLVTARVTRVDEGTVTAALDNGLEECYIERSDLSDKSTGSCKDLVSVGQTLPCRVLDVNRAAFSVRLSSRGSLLKKFSSSSSSSRRDHEDDAYLQIDPYEERESFRRRESRPRRKVQPKRTHAAVNHPLFQRYNYKEAEEALAGIEPGERSVVIRPSSRGLDHLTITWKFYDNVFIHTDVLEIGKANDLAVGQSFEVKGTSYEDLDEIIYRYIIPITEQARAVVNMRCFKGGDEKTIDKRLRADKEVNPDRIPYFIGGCKSYPGKFMLYYMPGHRPRHEYITPEAKGLRFRERLFKSPEHLIAWFKVHFKDPPSSRSSRRSHKRSRDGRSKSRRDDWH
eukprot:TRINITY_DN3820_c0_g1_i2.p1 TRINITY_DN3820_c0_g1~~TRINITY_DN3820_c0_g1_i2.p1  ORF type:complete len:591 (+),score=109.45 TRINITY_DN3820_c0_g1_i2:405-2177(+)